MRLLNEYPLLVFPSLATALGLNESIVLQQVHYWLEINKKSAKHDKFIDGRWWTYNSYSGWGENFPFWSENTIKRTVSSLENNGVLLSANHNEDKRDRTKWYSIDYEKLDGICEDRANASAQNDATASAQNDTTASTQFEPMINIQRIHTENTYRDKEEERKPTSQPTEICDGEFLEPDPEPLNDRSYPLTIHPQLVVNSESKTVPAAARGKKAIVIDSVARVCEAWNEGKGVLWALTRGTASGARRKAILRFLSEFDSEDEAIECFRGALEYMKTDRYWASADWFNIDKALTNGKIQQYYELYLARQENPAIGAVAEKLKEINEPKSFDQLRKERNARVVRELIEEHNRTNPEQSQNRTVEVA